MGKSVPTVPRWVRFWEHKRYPVGAVRLAPRPSIAWDPSTVAANVRDAHRSTMVSMGVAR